jgi:uncharacterized glyoxalase superfamily protein PhnB
MSEALTPIVVVRGAAHAIRFYMDASGAREVALHDAVRGDLPCRPRDRPSTTWVTEEARAWNSDSPAARLRDPFGHLWIVSQRLSELSARRAVGVELPCTRC